MNDPAQAREQLEARLVVLKQRAERIDGHQRNTSREIPKDWDDAAKVRDNDEVVDALEGHTDRDIHRVEAALRRLDEGTWSECMKCGREIAEARLAAMPAALFCVKCAEAQERH